MKDRSLVNAWNRAVGPQIGAKAQPDRLRGDVLYVRVANSVWMHELQFMKQDIISKLNGIPGGTKVAQIRFFIGEVEAPAVKRAEPEPQAVVRSLRPEEKDFIAGVVADVTDAELKEVLTRAISRSIMRGEKDS